MNYQCAETFMLRVPSLPLDYLEYTNSEWNDFTEVLESNNLMPYIRENLLISSPSLYKMLNLKTNDRKKISNRNIGLYKYFMRATTRPTPFGLFAGVSLGEFSDEQVSNLQIDCTKYKKDVKIDTLWVCQLIQKLESDDVILKSLKVRFNKNCYISGDRLKNPYYSNGGNISTINDAVQENNIKFTPLIQLIMNTSKSFINFVDLSLAIQNVYGHVIYEKIYDTLKTLVENEYLITELRLPNYCEDRLVHVLNILQPIQLQSAKEIFNSLNEIRTLANFYQESDVPYESERLLNEIYLRMSKIVETKNYLEINKGLSVSQNKLPINIQRKITHFVNAFSDIMVNIEDVHNLGKLANQFSETYGRGVEIPLVEAIDENQFNALQYIESTMKAVSNREHLIRGVIDEKIQRALRNKENQIILKANDFAINGFSLRPVKFPKSFDLNFIINYKDDGTARLQIGPNFGSNKAGSMFQRFTDVFDQDLLAKFNKIYLNEECITSDEYVLIEGRELSIAGRSNNLLNRKKNYQHCLPIAFSDGHTDDCHSIHDLRLGLSNEGDLYIFSEKVGRKSKIVNDNMLNISANGKVLKLLKTISNTYENSFFDRLSILSSNKYIYTPEIVFEDVVISPQKWIFDDSHLNVENYEDFCSTFKTLKNEYELDDVFYLCDYDNRLFINVHVDVCMQILYQSIKKSKKLELSAFENDMVNNAITKDQHEKQYFTEIICSMILSEKVKDETIHDNNQFERLLQKQSREIPPFEEGWIYLKLYGSGDRSDELITLLGDLKIRLDYQKFFFIRYSDIGGNHIRLRVKFENANKAISEFCKMNSYLLWLKSKGVINRWLIDTYEREFNRYGGSEHYDEVEYFFYQDSLIVIDLLSEFDLNNKDDIDLVYLVGMTSIFKAFYPNLDHLLEVLDLNVNRNQHRDLFQKNRKRYMNIVASVLNNEIFALDERLNTSQEYLVQREYSLSKIKGAMNSLYLQGKLSNEEAYIVFSLVHMFCNRINGTSLNEAIYLTIIRHACFALTQKNKSLNFQIS